MTAMEIVSTVMVKQAAQAVCAPAVEQESLTNNDLVMPRHPRIGDPSALEQVPCDRQGSGTTTM